MVRPVVLVHGAWHGPWCWERVTPHLDRAGIPWVAPDLPSCARAAEGADLTADTVAVEAALDALPGSEPAVLCGHSRGGIVISEAGAHPRVAHLVYLTAFLLAAGEDMGASLGDTDVVGSLDVHANGTTTVKPGPGANVFYNDCAGEDITWASARLRPLFMAGSGPQPPREAWRTRPSTYVVCTKDQAISAAAQRKMALRAGATVEWDTGHSPFLNRPELVAALLIGLSRG
jgi:pimeloyl-ACP methyl ester carboxylesterase